MDNNMNEEGGVATVTANDMSDLKMSMMYGDLKDPKKTEEVLKEMTFWGNPAKALVPLLIEKLPTGACIYPDIARELIRLLAVTKSDELKDYLGEKGCGWGRDRKTEALSAGCICFEDELLRTLSKNWAEVGRFPRTYIVQAVGEGGTEKSLELLRVLEVRLLGQIPEKKIALERAIDAEASGDDEIVSVDLMMDGFALNAQKGLLDEVHSAIKKLEARYA